jgi:hypothetical protein
MKKTRQTVQKQGSHEVVSHSADIILHPKYRDTLDSLLKEQKDILGQIEKERQKLSRFVAASSHIGGALLARLRPIMEEIDQIRRDASRLARILLEERKKIPRHIVEPLIGLAHIHDADEDGGLCSEFEEILRNFESNSENNQNNGTSDDEPRLTDEEDLSEQQVAGKPRNPTLRELYLELSRAFHPDKATNDEERERFHLYMRDINTWYKAGDMSSLIQFSLSVKESMPSTALSSDILSQEEERLRSYIADLKGDLRALKTGYRHLRKMVPEPKLVDRVIKGKANLEKDLEEGFEEAREELRKYFQLRDTLALVIRKKRPITALETVFGLFFHDEIDQDDSDEGLDISEALVAMMEAIQQEFNKRR